MILNIIIITASLGICVVCMVLYYNIIATARMNKHRHSQNESVNKP
jgi:hypothetical protein